MWNVLVPLLGARWWHEAQPLSKWPWVVNPENCPTFLRKATATSQESTRNACCVLLVLEESLDLRTDLRLIAKVYVTLANNMVALTPPPFFLSLPSFSFPSFSFWCGFYSVSLSFLCALSRTEDIIAQLEECLPRTHEALGSIPHKTNFPETFRKFPCHPLTPPQLMTI